MKNLKLGLMLCLTMMFGWVSAQTYDVTFSVDMAGYSGTFTTPTVNGSFASWCGNCAPMTNTTGTIWEATVSIDAGVHDYKFAHDDWAGEENLLGLTGCPINTDGANFANRQVDVQADVVLPTVCWEECVDCASAASAGCTDSAAQNYDAAATSDNGTCEYLLTLTVDMSNEASSGPVNSVFGSFNSWTPGATVLADNGDGTWSATVTVQNGAYEYKFHNDGVGALGEEIFAGGESCTITTGAFTNRLINVTADTDVSAVCWQACVDCATANMSGCTDSSASNYNAAATTDDGTCTYLLTLTVDMSNEGAIGPVNSVFGSFNSWTPGASVLADNGDGTWSISLEVANGTYEYKFHNDGAGALGEEIFAGGESCTITTGSFTNRIVTVSGATDVSVVCWESCAVCPPSSDGCTDSAAQNYDTAAVTDDGSCEYLTTLTVDMSNETVDAAGVHVAGSFQGWNPGSTALTDNGDGTWSVDVAAADATELVYIFINGNDWPGQEIVPMECGLDNGQGGYNRTYTTGAADAAVASHCFSSCSDCVAGQIFGCTDSSAQNYDAAATDDDGSCQYLLSISVDMTDVTGFTQPTVNGTFNGWCGNCNPLTDNGDGTWSTTLTVGAGGIEYKFAADDWAIQEEFVGGESCTLTTGAFTNRFVDITADTTISLVCWNSCVDCGAANTLGCTDPSAQNYDAAATTDDGLCSYLLTLTVDLSEAGITFTQPTVNGTFNGWCGNCNPLTDNGDGTWSTTITVQNGEVEYKFAADDWAVQEEFAGGESCTLTTDGFTNRVVNVTGDTTLDEVCWNSCAACGVVEGCTDPDFVEFNPEATLDDGSCSTLRVYGCAYADADNFDPQANTDDGSCTFTLGNACPGDFNEDGTVTASDLTQFLAVFGLDCE